MMPLAYYMSKVSDDMVRRAYIARMIDAKGRAARAWQMMADDGYERVSDDSPDILADGRAVVRAGGAAWAVRPDIHAARVRAALDAERARRPVRDASGSASRTCTAILDGQLCGGSLKMATVCPRCTLGRHGVAATLTCDVCGAVTAVMRGAE